MSALTTYSGQNTGQVSPAVNIVTPTPSGNAGQAMNTNFTAIADALASVAGQLATIAAALAGKADASTLTAHTTNTGNPHSVTKAQVGLGNADNTSDANKPVSTAQQNALNARLLITGGTMVGPINMNLQNITNAASYAIDGGSVVIDSTGVTVTDGSSPTVISPTDGIVSPHGYSGSGGQFTVDDTGAITGASFQGNIIGAGSYQLWDGYNIYAENVIIAYSGLRTNTVEIDTNGDGDIVCSSLNADASSTPWYVNNSGDALFHVLTASTINGEGSSLYGYASGFSVGNADYANSAGSASWADYSGYTGTADYANNLTGPIGTDGTGNISGPSWAIYNDGSATIQTLNIANIPTSSSGLNPGDVWNDSGTLKIV